jgi:glutathione-regulated potassium-efflux system ancillary protein KefG
MAKILVLFFHPALEKSRVHVQLLEQLKLLEDITLHDLYEAYPDFAIDVAYEKELLENHDLIVWQHPLYWYSCPPLMKQWMDLTLEHGWAYGSNGTALQGKAIFNVVSTGGQEVAYNTEASGKADLRTLLLPFEQTAKLCKMTYLPPYVVHGTHRLTPAEIDGYAIEYARLMILLRNDQIDFARASLLRYFNDMIKMEITY